MEAERKLLKTEENMRQAQALQKEIKPHIGHLERLVERFKQASEIKSSLEKALKEYLSRSLKTLKDAEAGLESKIAGPAVKLAELEKKIADLRKKLGGFEKREKAPEALEELESKLAGLRAKKAELLRELGRLEGMIEAGKADSGDAESVPRDEVEDFFSQVEDVLSSAMDTDIVEEMHAIIQDAVSRLGVFLGRFAGREEAKPQAENISKKKSELEKELKSLSEEESKIAGEREKTSREFYETGREGRQIEREIFELEKHSNELRDSLRAMDLEREKIKMRKEEFSRDLEEGRRYLGAEISDDDSHEIFKEEEREKMRKEVDRLKFRMEEAGGVDPDVVKEYEELKERENFFARELTDLGQAAKSLRQISRELGEKIEHDFGRGVEKINKEFEKFFQTMFGGGRAKLIVLKAQKIKKGTDADEEGFVSEDTNGEGGVDIDVGLPRKKIRGLDMLSGGERALTSIALLFAMSTVNPPPFLILDETDAALDESNSRRYGDMLKNLSLTTQIITITHNRETMKQAGALYGVTIGSDGVSRLLSLKLTEAEELAQ